MKPMRLGRTTDEVGGPESEPSSSTAAEPDSVSLAQGPIDGARLSHAHLGTADQRGNIRWIGVTIADETPVNAASCRQSP